VKDAWGEFGYLAPDLGLGGDFGICMEGGSHGATVGGAHPQSQENCMFLSLFVRYQTVTCKSLI
jgi:hypothetical protein